MKDARRIYQKKTEAELLWLERDGNVTASAELDRRRKEKSKPVKRVTVNDVFNNPKGWMR